MINYTSRTTVFFILLLLVVAACADGNSTINSTATQPGVPAQSTSTFAATESPTPNPAISSTPQPYPTPVTYGPNEFPAGFNPLTGQRVSDPSQLDYPALLLSISHFPPAARPQAGFSFTPWVYEYYITEETVRWGIKIATTPNQALHATAAVPGS